VEIGKGKEKNLANCFKAVFLCNPTPSEDDLNYLLANGVEMGPKPAAVHPFLPYPDFIPRRYPAGVPEHLGRHKTSIFDGLRYYFTQHASLLESLSSPSCTTLFPLKIISSQYCVLHAFINFQTATMRSTGWALQRQNHEQQRAADDVELAWSRFRCSDYLEAIESILDSLGIPYSEPPTPTNIYNRRRDGPARPRRAFTGASLLGLADGDDGPAAVQDWRCHASDFLFLHRQFVLRRLDYDRITTSIAALLSIIMGRLGIDEAKTVKTLTYVAMAFAPLSWVASVFSLSENSVYGPTRPQFWQYWATALPATVAVFLVFLSWQVRLDLAGSGVVAAWKAALRRRVKIPGRGGQECNDSNERDGDIRLQVLV
jgi:hypothetical protein